jgi:hypothetical protein
MNPKMKTIEGEGVEAHSLAYNIFKVRGASSWMGIRMSDKHVNYSYQYAQTKQQVD